MTTRVLEVPAAVLAAVVARERLGKLHVSLAPLPTWRDDGPPDFQEELASLGWGGELDRDVVSSLRVLCSPSIAYYGWLTHDGTTISVLSAALGSAAVLAVKDGDVVRLRSIRARELVPELIAQLPDVPPGRGTPITVSLSELRATDRRGRHRAPGGVVTKRARPEVLRAQELLALPTTGAGELYSGQQAPLCYIDTVDGRYVVSSLDADTVRVAPASASGLVPHLDGIRLGA
jgi:hypothetical protein